MSKNIPVADIYKNSMQATKFIKLLSNNTRLIVLCSLIEQQRSVNDLVKIANISQSALSQHLSKMSKSNIIQGQRLGNQIFYSISDQNVYKIIKTLHEIFCR